MVIKSHLSSKDPTKEQDDSCSLDYKRIDTYKDVVLAKVSESESDSHLAFVSYK